MKKRKVLMAALAAILAVAMIGGCTAMTGGEGDEEMNTSLALDETHDEVHNGAHLILNYDKAAKAFTGTVQNTTNATLQQVRVEVHLSNGTELGPTMPQDLAVGRGTKVRLDAAGEEFTTWSAHAEVGPQSGGGEHGPDGEGGGS